MRLLPFLLHAAAAKLQFGADANNTRKGSKRRRNIERVYAVRTEGPAARGKAGG